MTTTNVLLDGQSVVPAGDEHRALYEQWIVEATEQ